MLSRAGPRYLRGSNSAGFVAKTSRMAAVMARRESESMLILQTALLAALRRLLLGNAHGSLPATAVLVDRIDLLLGNRRRSVEHDGEARKLLLDSCQHVECQGGGTRRPVLGSTVHCSGGELVGAVRRADRDGQRIHARLGHEVHDLLGLGVVALLGYDLVLDAGQHAQARPLPSRRTGGRTLRPSSSGRRSHRREAPSRRSSPTRSPCPRRLLQRLERVAVVEVQHDLGLCPAQAPWRTPRHLRPCSAAGVWLA